MMMKDDRKRSEINEQSPLSKTAKERHVQSKKFSSLRKRDLEGLLKNGTFMPIPPSEVSNSVRIFVSMFIENLKRVQNGTMLKIRLVSHNYSSQTDT